MEIREKIEKLRSTGMEGRAGGSNGADRRQIELGHDGSKDSRRKAIEAFHAAILVRHFRLVNSIQASSTLIQWKMDAVLGRHRRLRRLYLDPQPRSDPMASWSYILHRVLNKYIIYKIILHNYFGKK